MADFEQRTSELLAREHDARGEHWRATNLRRARVAPYAAEVASTDGAQRSAPDGFALLDLDENSLLSDTPKEQMLDAGWPDSEMIGDRFDKQAETYGIERQVRSGEGAR
ncbi:MAG: hypothetical protein ACRES5_05665 [Pseudomonas sp.]|uniref:hypothetical protein n=1 Tax=Stenotrophomonas sp. TaxID=69392 RepID=UPI003D6C8D89